MKIFSPFRLMNSPLVIASLGLQALNEGADLVRQVNEDQQQKLLAQSMISGQPVTSEPGGAIRHFASAATGGAISPDIEASGDTLMQEQLMMQKRQEEQVKLQGAFANIRSKVGAGPFQPGGSFDMMLQHSGLPSGSFAGPTDAELNEQQKVKQQEITNKRLSPEGRAAGAAASKQAELDVENQPSNVMASLAKDRLKSSQDAAIHEGAALDTKRRELSMEAGVAPTEAYNKKVAEMRAADDYTNAMSLPTYKTKTGNSFVDADLNEATSSYKGGVGAATADTKNLTLVHKGKEAEQIADSRAVVKRLEALRPLLAKYLPSAKGKNEFAIKKAQYEQGVKNYANSNVGELATAYSTLLDAVAIERRANGRFPGQRILNIPLLPEFGNIVSSSEGGVFGAIGLKHHTYTPADTYEAASLKLNNAIARVKEGTTGLVKEGDGTGDDDDLPDPMAISPGAKP